MPLRGPWQHLFDVASRYVSDPIAPDDSDVDFASMSHLIQVDSIASAIGRLNDVVAAACTDVHYVCTDSEACWLGLGLGLGLGLLTLTLTLTLTRAAARGSAESRADRDAGHHARRPMDLVRLEIYARYISLTSTRHPNANLAPEPDF